MKTGWATIVAAVPLVLAVPVLVLVTFVLALHAQDSSPQWKDPSAHPTRFVTVDKNVELEVLDWGGPREADDPSGQGRPDGSLI